MNEPLKTLATYLEHLEKDLMAMQGLLGLEAIALERRDPKMLTEVSHEKTELADRIGKLVENQDALLFELGFPAGRAGMEVLLGSLSPQAPETLDLRDRWERIGHVNNDCNRLNELNGAYIGLLNRHVERTLDLLHGRDTTEFVYGPDGGSRRPSASRKLISV